MTPENDLAYVSGSLQDQIDTSSPLDLDELPEGLKCSAEEQLLFSKSRLPNVLQAYVEDIAHIFDWRSYQSNNQDLAEMSPLQLVDHFLVYGIAEWRHFRSEQTPLMDRKYSVAAKLGTDVHLKVNFQVLVHCFHLNVLLYIIPYLRYISRLGGKIILMVTNDTITDVSLESLLEDLYSGSVRHEFYRVPNKGEDWSSFHEAFKMGIFDHDGITFKMQTKKSAHLGNDGGNVWIDEALSPICGSYQALIKVLNAHRCEGALISASELTRFKGFGANPALLENYIDRLGIKEANYCSEMPFAGGSMFAVSNHFIRQFYMRLGDVDYDADVQGGGKYCGRFIGHALERVFFYYADTCNYSKSPIHWFV